MSRSRDIISGLLHAVGLGLAIAALVVMVIWTDSARAITGVTIFGSGLILLYFASATYHLLPPRLLKTKAVLRRIDHAMIYVLIAATYTPICLMSLPAGWGWSLFGVNWGLAVLGVISKSIPRWKVPAWLSVIHYLAMGWLIGLALPILIQQITWAGFSWLLLGGVAYTVGVIFFCIKQHELFHLWVMVGSFCHFWFMLWFI